MKLPNGHRAHVGDKLEAYSLNPLHREGRNKARVFRAALGISLENADVLRGAILSAAANSADSETRGDNGFGEVFVLRVPVTTTVGHAIVLTVWIVRHGEDFPRLANCYIV